MAGTSKSDFSGADMQGEVYKKVLQTVEKSFCEWYGIAAKVYDKDELEKKFEQFRTRVEHGYDEISIWLLKELEEKQLQELLNEITEICSQLGITLPDVDFINNPPSSLLTILQQNLKKLKERKTGNTLNPTNSQFALKTPRTHKRISQSYEQFQQELCKRKDKRSTGLFWKEDGVPKIVVNNNTISDFD